MFLKQEERNERNGIGGAVIIGGADGRLRRPLRYAVIISLPALQILFQKQEEERNGIGGAVIISPPALQFLFFKKIKKKKETREIKLAEPS